MAKTVVIYHSGYGHTQRVAQFVAQGANAASSRAGTASSSRRG